MGFQSPGDVLFAVNGFRIYNYGIIMAFACLVGVIVSYFVFKYKNPDSAYEKISDLSIILLISGILGARLYYCILNSGYYFHHPLQVFNFREGGLSIHGALLVGIVVLFFIAKNLKLGYLKLLDAFACGTALAQSIGRWGNFFNSEAFGSPTNLPWKLFIPIERRPSGYEEFEYFHPTFLYESILDLCIFIILFLLIRKLPKSHTGITFFVYLIAYSLVRFIVEGLRLDSALNVSGIPIAQIMSIILFIIGFLGCIYLIFKNRVKIS